MNATLCNIAVVPALIVMGMQPSESTHSATTLRQLLLAPDFQDAGIRKVFRDGSAATTELVRALDDTDERVNENAQLLLRLIGDEQGIRALHRWYETPRTVLRIINGPIPTPLREWDYRQIELMLARPYREWREDAVNYLLAMAIDDSQRARDLLQQTLRRIPQNKPESSLLGRVAHLIVGRGPKADVYGAGAPEAVVRRMAFFLTPKEKRRSVVRLWTYADRGNLALVTTSQTFGDTFWVVLKKEGTCWHFQSAAHRSTNN